MTVFGRGDDGGIEKLRNSFRVLLRNVRVSDAREHVLIGALRITLLADSGKRGHHGGSCWE